MALRAAGMFKLWQGSLRAAWPRSQLCAGCAAPRQTCDTCIAATLDPIAAIPACWLGGGSCHVCGPRPATCFPVLS